MNQSEEIKKMKLELGKFKNEVNVWSINIGLIIQNIALAVDKQDRNLLNLIIEADKQNRIDTDRALQNISNYQRFSLRESMSQNSKFNSEVSDLKKDLDLFKENSDISLIFHDAKYKELENFLLKSNLINEISAKDIDNILVEKFKLEKNKTRIINNKKINMTLPTYIRHHFHHLNEEKNEVPTIKEVNNSISIILDILKNKY